MAQQRNEQFAGADPGNLEPWIANAPLSADDMRRAHGWLIVAASCALMAGLISIAVPIITSVTIAILIGWVLLIGGATMGAHAFSDRAALKGLEALVTFLAGLYILLFPLSGTVTLTFVLAVWFFAGGLLSLASATRATNRLEATMAFFSATISMLLGVLIAVELPSSAAWAIGLLVGVNIIFWSIRAIGTAQILKQRLNEL
jgi:uncharacterized membrane protein HdeD (DUF308 family)